MVRTPGLNLFAVYIYCKKRHAGAEYRRLAITTGATGSKSRTTLPFLLHVTKRIYLRQK